MAEPRTFDADARAKARALFDQGMSCNRIARELGWAPSTISKWAREEGLTFDRTSMVAANSARSVDAKTRRLSIMARLLDRTEALLDRLDAAQFDTLVPVGMGEQSPRALDFVPSIDERNLASSLAMYLKEARELEKLDADQGVGDAESLLTSIAEELGLLPTAGDGDA